MSLRWEWRTFGDDLAERLGALDPEQVTESDEIYLLSPRADDAVKLRAGLMDVKRLERVGDDGLELWTPAWRSPRSARRRPGSSATRMGSPSSPRPRAPSRSPSTRRGGTSPWVAAWRS
jgi:hypothetical protein